MISAIVGGALVGNGFYKIKEERKIVSGLLWIAAGSVALFGGFGNE